MRVSIKLVLLYLGIQLITGTLCTSVAEILVKTGYASSAVSNSNSIIISLLLSFVIMCVYMYKKREIDFRPRTWSFVSVTFILLTVVMAFSMVVLIDFLSYYLRWLPDWTKGTFDGLVLNWLGLIAISIAGPVFEELLFRGAVTRHLLNEYKPMKAIIVSALIFGIGHLNPAQMIPGILGGIVIAMLYYRTGSLVPGIVLHIINNSVSAISMKIYPKVDSLETLYQQWDIPLSYDVFVVAALIIFVSTAYVMHQLLKRHQITA